MSDTLIPFPTPKPPRPDPFGVDAEALERGKRLMGIVTLPDGRQKRYAELNHAELTAFVEAEQWKVEAVKVAPIREWTGKPLKDIAEVVGMSVAEWLEQEVEMPDGTVKRNLCRDVTIAQGLAVLRALGPPEQGENKSRWRAPGVVGGHVATRTGEGHWSISESCGRSRASARTANTGTKARCERRMGGSVTQMPWQTRAGGRRYYTRSTRRDGRVVRQYVGSGEAGEAAAAADQEGRAARDAKREAVRSALSRLAEVDAQVTTLCDAAETATRAVLMMAGLHRHARGQWRRRRG